MHYNCWLVSHLHEFSLYYKHRQGDARYLTLLPLLPESRCFCRQGHSRSGQPWLQTRWVDIYAEVWRVCVTGSGWGEVWVPRWGWLWNNFLSNIWDRSYCTLRAGCELVGSWAPPASASRVAKTTHVRICAWLCFEWCINILLRFLQ